MSDSLNVIACSGSLRRESFNNKLLKVCQSRAPDGMNIEIFDQLNDIPVFNQDLLDDSGFPPAVEALREKIAAADGLLISSPEYNHAVSCVTKNWLDWVSRPPDQPFRGKAMAITGAGMGALGTALGQYSLRHCFVFLDGRIMNQPEVFVSAAHTKFDDDGNLTDEPTLEFVDKFLNAFAAWIPKVSE